MQLSFTLCRQYQGKSCIFDGTIHMAGKPLYLQVFSVDTIQLPRAYMFLQSELSTQIRAIKFCKARSLMFCQK